MTKYYKCSSIAQPHPAKKVFNSFQTLLNHIQGCLGCQMKGKTSIYMNLVVFFAKIRLELKNLQKCGKDTKICIFLRFFTLSLSVIQVQRKIPQKSNSLKFSTTFDTPFTLEHHQGVEILPFLKCFSIFSISSATWWLIFSDEKQVSNYPVLILVSLCTIFMDSNDPI